MVRTPASGRKGTLLSGRISEAIRSASLGFCKTQKGRLFPLAVLHTPPLVLLVYLVEYILTQWQLTGYAVLQGCFRKPINEYTG